MKEDEIVLANIYLKKKSNNKKAKQALADRWGMPKDNSQTYKRFYSLILIFNQFV